MFTIITFNLFLFVLSLIIYGIIWSVLGRKLFFDFTYILLLRVILFPALLGIVNIIYIKTNNLDVYNYLVPLIWFIYPVLRIYISNKNQNKQDKVYREIAPQIRLLIKDKASQLEEHVEDEDILIIKRDENKNKKDTFKVVMNMNLNKYSEDQFLEKINQFVIKKLPSIMLDLYINEKEDKKKHSISPRKFIEEF
ncbi:hypothetical protein [Priestia aryabhattai]|uniref:hypothetical protein n=1 Tax=Priestia aryabhattai TaxID=412384 RepID=UPI0030D2B472